MKHYLSFSIMTLTLTCQLAQAASDIPMSLGTIITNASTSNSNSQNRQGSVTVWGNTMPTSQTATAAPVQQSVDNVTYKPSAEINSAMSSTPETLVDSTQQSASATMQNPTPPVEPPKPPPEDIRIVDQAFSCKSTNGRPFTLSANGTELTDNGGHPATITDLKLHLFKTRSGRDMGYAVQGQLEDQSLILAHFNLPLQKQHFEERSDEIQAANNRLKWNYQYQMSDYQSQVDAIQKMQAYNNQLFAAFEGRASMPVMPYAQAPVITYDSKGREKVVTPEGPQYYQIPMMPTRPSEPTLASMPVEPRISSSVYYGTERGHITSSMSLQVQDQSIASMRCRKTDHNVRENVHSNGEIAVYGGTIRKRQVVYNEGHQEQWCDSENFEGSLKVNTLGGTLNVVCSKASSSQQIVDMLYNNTDNMDLN